MFVILNPRSPRQDSLEQQNIPKYLPSSGLGWGEEEESGEREEGLSIITLGPPSLKKNNGPARGSF
jgi:hypothetical protein